MLLVLRRLWIQVTADRKRFGLLCGTLAVGLLLWARLIVVSNLPRTVVADEPLPMPDQSSPTAAASSASDNRDRHSLRVELSRVPIGDPFEISAKHFPKPTPVIVLTQEEAKSRGEATENPEQAEARLTEQLRALVDRFDLEAVMQGRPMVAISGRTYRLHDWIPARGNDQIRFQLVNVGHRSVVLECEGRQFELQMKSPGSE